MIKIFLDFVYIKTTIMRGELITQPTVPEKEMNYTVRAHYYKRKLIIQEAPFLPNCPTSPPATPTPPMLPPILAPDN